MIQPQLSTYHEDGFDLQQPFDIAVIIPTLLRDSLKAALYSIFEQDFKGRVHILLGVDKAFSSSFDIEIILRARPKHMALTLFWPGYSTNKLHGGTHHALGGGSLRSLLSFLGNAHYVAYLDDDNWFSPNHLSSLHSAIQGKKWAFSKRWFVDNESLNPICEDTWESVGPHKGVFTSNFDGFVDTNCLMLNTLACVECLATWSRALMHDPQGRSADRHIFSKLKQLSPFGQTNQASVSYVVSPNDQNQKARGTYLKKQRLPSGLTACQNWTKHPTGSPVHSQKTIKSGQLSLYGNFEKPFDVSVVIPTIGHKQLKQAVNSIFKQDFKGRVQILVFIDKMLGSPSVLDNLPQDMPDSMALLIMDPHYSTSQRHGGLFAAHDGGAGRTILSFLANAPYVAYLDDDNRWEPYHLSSLRHAIQHKHYAFSLRTFIHPNGYTPIAIDRWESLGPKKGMYAKKFNGFIDPNCLMLDLQSCLNILPSWTTPLKGDVEKMSADRVVFYALSKSAQGNATGRASVRYVLCPSDPMHRTRTMYLGHSWVNGDAIAFKKTIIERILRLRQPHSNKESP